MRAAVALALALGAGGASAEVVRLAAGPTVLEIDTVGGLPVSWVACAGDCADTQVARQQFVGRGGGEVRWTGRAAESLAETRYHVETSGDADRVVAVLTAVAPGAPRVQRYEVDRAGHRVRLQLQVPAGTGVSVAGGASFVPAPLPGFGAAFGDVDVVTVTEAGQAEALPPGSAATTLDPPASAWLGMRQRFWALLARSPAGVSAAAETREANRPRLSWTAGSEGLDLVVYAGPVERKALAGVDPTLRGMLFAGLWAPLRWLCFGLLLLLEGIMGMVASAGVAIVLLSLAVKVILWPLTRIADRWQADVNRTQARLQPRLAEIRRDHRGEEAHRLTLQAYRDAGVHPLFTMKSLAGFAIQVPMFIAAFDMLADNFALAGEPFLWVDDLAAPDRFAALPAALPFFGAHFNLLPALMTLLTVVSALTQRDESLTPELLKKQRRQLYLMAGGFFLLFYTFPAGMVLYWTANNAWHLLKVQVAQGWSGGRRRD